ncbi:hypothetical protein VNO77_47738 [Canavalia gladiata]|uniref:Uncharacterized protein n=1 Tax=Canavalia gladiata TaxID=3824 RepID=A0AAN9PHG4_CANGL
MVELKRSILRARSSINSAKASQSTASEKTSYLVRKYSLNMGFYLICSPLLTNWRTGEGGRKEQLRSPEDRPPYVMLTNPADPSPDA